jgi:hypothetical protein
MWLFITTDDQYERAFNMISGHVYLNYETDDDDEEDRRKPYIELSFPAENFVVKFEPAGAAEQYYQRLKSAIKMGRTQFDNVEEGFRIVYMENEAEEE